MAQRKRPKLADVARLAGVSQAAVSVVLNNRVGNSARVSAETQQRVWDAVRTLGYVANPLARRLAGGRTHILAVFTFEPVFPLDHRNFYYPFLIGLEAEASRHGYDLLLLTSPDEGRRRHIYRDGVNRLRVADGAILLGFGDRAEVEALLDEGYPFVFVGRRDSTGDRVSYVAADYTAATAEITRQLLSQGHERLAYLQSEENESARDRLLGYQCAHELAGRRSDARLHWLGSPSAFGVPQLRALVEAGATALVAENDALGERVLAACAVLGLSCPTDFSLAVLGDPLSFQAPEYSWTTFKVPRVEMGAEAVRLLVRMLNDNLEPGADSYRSTLACTVEPGVTVGPPPRAGVERRWLSHNT